MERIVPDQNHADAETLVDFAYNEIRKDITSDFLKQNSKVIIKSLCGRYGISPTPIKQALNRLIMQGLVENVPRKGYRIRRVTWNSIDEIFDLRLMMTVFFIPKVIISVNSNSELQKRFESNIEKNLELAKTYATAKEFLAVYELDQQFHELYIISSGNHTALRAYRGLNTHNYALSLYNRQPQEKTVEGILEHRRIYDALRQGDAGEVEKQLAVHDRNAREKIYLTLKLANLL
jgi:DNA-binding GntR family transcriptional regulator